VKIDINRLKNYLSDLDPNTSFVDEAIATIEAVAENKTDDELYERERPLMIAYLALRIVKAGLNVYRQNDEVHAHWVEVDNDGSYCVFCSKCRTAAHPITDLRHPENWLYCPHCGAKMGEDESEG
jgi:hypothetical protein